MALLSEPRRGGCFMCFTEISTNSTAEPENNNKNTSILPFKLLTRYLKLDLGNVLGGTATATTTRRGGASPGKRSFGSEEEQEVVSGVPLCSRCGALTRKFSELYQLLDVVRLEADAVVAEIHGVMVAGAAACDKRGTTRPEDDDLGEASTLLLSRRHKLRKEVLQKSSNLIKRTLPRVDLRRLDNSFLTGSEPKHFPREDCDNKKNAAKMDDISNKGRDPPQNNPEPNLMKTKIIVSEEESQDGIIISFKKLASGRYQCSNCGKAVLKHCIQPHKKVHNLAGKSGGVVVKCPICAISFRRTGALQDHKLWKHRELFFDQHKSPSLTPAEFKRVLGTLFDSVLQRDGGVGGAYKCGFCNRFPKNGKRRAQTHLIRHHMGELVPRLMELQPQNNNNNMIQQVGDGAEMKTNEVVNHQIKTSPESTNLQLVAASSILYVAGISFKKLVNGYYSCSICNKEIPRELISSHQSCRSAAGSTFKCNICSKMFKRKSYLHNHKYWMHRSHFFAKHKEPTLTWAAFERLLVTLFEQIEIPKIRPGAYKCIFCENKIVCMSRRDRIENHFIRVHMDQLLPRLMELQSGIRLLPPSPPPPADVNNDEKLVVQTGGGGMSSSSLECELCLKSFPRWSNLYQHKFWKHRSHFFANHKEPSLTPEQFEGAIVTLFEGIEIPKVGHEKYTCSFCACEPMTRKGNVISHFIRCHMDQLVPRLMELQKSQIIAGTSMNELGLKPEGSNNGHPLIVAINSLLVDSPGERGGCGGELGQEIPTSEAFQEAVKQEMETMEYEQAGGEECIGDLILGI